MIAEVIAVFAAIFFVGGTSGGLDGSLNMLALFADLPSLISIIILTVPILIRKNEAGDLKKAFRMLSKKNTYSLADMKRAKIAVEFAQKQILCAGAIISILGMVNILKNLSDMSKLGPSLAVVILSVFYAAILELLLLPVQVEVSSRIVNFMEE